MTLSLFKDARHFQILFQSIFLGFGIAFLGWEAEWWLYATYFAVSIATQIVFELLRSRSGLWMRLQSGLPSVFISSFGLCLLLKTSYAAVAALAAFVSISSKFIIRVNGKHVFNPSALGIVAAILLTDKAWFSPGQWGSSVIILFGVGCLGVIVLTKVQKLDTSLAFLLTFSALLFMRQILYLGWPIDYFVQSISTGSILLFSFFMITDPRTTPNHQTARILWSMLIAITSFYLVTFQFINGAPVWVLVLLQPLVPLLDTAFKSTTFQWKKVAKATDNSYPKTLQVS